MCTLIKDPYYTANYLNNLSHTKSSEFWTKHGTAFVDAEKLIEGNFQICYFTARKMETTI